MPVRYHSWLLNYLEDNFDLGPNGIYSFPGLSSNYMKCAYILNLPDLYFLYGGHWFGTSPSNYIIDYGGPDCFVCLTPTGNDYWILGDAFMRGYYVTHDYTSK